MGNFASQAHVRIPDGAGTTHEFWLHRRSTDPRGMDDAGAPKPGVGQNPGSLKAEAGQAVGSSTPADGRPSFRPSAGGATFDGGRVPVWSEFNVLLPPATDPTAKPPPSPFAEACEALRRRAGDGDVEHIVLDDTTLPQQSDDVDRKAYWVLTDDGCLTIGLAREDLLAGEEIQLDAEQTRRLARMLVSGVEP